MLNPIKWNIDREKAIISESLSNDEIKIEKIYKIAQNVVNFISCEKESFSLLIMKMKTSTTLKTSKNGKANVITFDSERFPLPPPVENGSKQIDSEKRIYKALLYKLSESGKNIY